MGMKTMFFYYFCYFYQLISKCEIERFLILELHYKYITEKLTDTKIKYDKVKVIS